MATYNGWRPPRNQSWTYSIFNDQWSPVCFGEKASIWKYVDDVSISETLARHPDSTLQHDLNTIHNWAGINWMNLSIKKCKEMRIYLFRQQPPLPSLSIDNHHLDIVTSHKILGLTLQNDLKWGSHIDDMVRKGSKRLHIIRVLGWAGVPQQELVLIYISLIRSILEYCCPVWHTSLPQYLLDSVERIQKRTFRIMYPDLSYKEALKQLRCSTLYERRENICMRTMNRIEQSGGHLSRLLPLTRDNAHDHDLRNNNNRTPFFSGQLSTKIVFSQLWSINWTQM